MSDDGHDDSVTPTSEVGSKRVNEKTRGDNLESTQWRMMFEMQNEQIRALIQALNVPGPTNTVTLPEFDPDKRDADPQSWCATADLCLADKPLNGCQLIVTLSKALKGTASTWLSQVTYAGITWPQFKELFCARFVPTETIPATLIHLNTSRSNDGESYAAYASRLISSLMNRWKNASMEQIAVSVVLAHFAQIDTRLQRLAFTTEIRSRHNLQQELQAYSFLKRKVHAEDDTSDHAKRARMSTIPMRCYICGKPGHKQVDCRLKGKKYSTPVTTHVRSSQQPTLKGALICFKCGQPGHIASHCDNVASVATASTSAVPRAQHRVDLCMVEPPSSTLRHNATGTSRAKGQVQRTMSTLKSMLTAVETSENRSWQDALGDVQLALNCTVNRVTKTSPLELLIGKVARPLSLMANDNDDSIDIDQVRENAAQLMEKSAKYDKERFDKTKATLDKFSIGDFVLLQNEERNQVKLDPKYKGPFKVVEVLDGDRYTLRALNSKRTYKYAHERLRRMPEGQVPIELDEIEQSDSNES